MILFASSDIAFLPLEMCSSFQQRLFSKVFIKSCTWSSPAEYVQKSFTVSQWSFLSWSGTYFAGRYHVEFFCFLLVDDVQIPGPRLSPTQSAAHDRAQRSMYRKASPSRSEAFSRDLGHTSLGAITYESENEVESRKVSFLWPETRGFCENYDFSKTTVESWKLKFFLDAGLVLVRSFPVSFCEKIIKKIFKNKYFSNKRKNIKFFKFLKIKNFKCWCFWNILFEKVCFWNILFEKVCFWNIFHYFFKNSPEVNVPKRELIPEKNLASSLREILIFAKPVEKTDFRPQESGFLALRALNFVLRLIWLVILVRRSWWPCFRRLSSSPEVLVTYCEFQERSLSLVGTSLKSKSMIF